MCKGAVEMSPAIHCECPAWKGVKVNEHRRQGQLGLRKRRGDRPREATFNGQGKSPFRAYVILLRAK